MEQVLRRSGALLLPDRLGSVVAQRDTASAPARCGERVIPRRRRLAPPPQPGGTRMRASAGGTQYLRGRGSGGRRGRAVRDRVRTGGGGGGRRGPGARPGPGGRRADGEQAAARP